MPETNPFQDDPRLDEAWQTYTHDAEGSPMMDPNEIRRHGDRRRRRRAATGLAGVAAAAVLAVGVIFAVTAFDNQTPEFAGTPSPNPTQGPTEQPTEQPTDEPTDAPSETETPGLPPSDDQLDQYLPSGQEIFLDVPGDLGDPLLVDGLSTASGEDRLFICEYDENLPPDQQDNLASQPGLVDARTAIFSSDGVIYRAHVMQMDSADRATALASTISGWADACDTRGTGWNGEPAEGYTEQTLDMEGVRVDFSVQKLRVSEDESIWNGMLVLTYEDRLLIVGDFVQGNDYNAVGPALHQEDPNLPLVSTARELDAIIDRLKG